MSRTGNYTAKLQPLTKQKDMKTAEIKSVYVVTNEQGVFVDVFDTAAKARRYCKDNESEYTYSKVEVS